MNIVSSIPSRRVAENVRILPRGALVSLQNSLQKFCAGKEPDNACPRALNSVIAGGYSAATFVLKTNASQAAGSFLYTLSSTRGLAGFHENPTRFCVARAPKLRPYFDNIQDLSYNRSEASESCGPSFTFVNRTTFFCNTGKAVMPSVGLFDGHMTLPERDHVFGIN